MKFKGSVPYLETLLKCKKIISIEVSSEPSWSLIWNKNKKHLLFMVVLLLVKYTIPTPDVYKLKFGMISINHYLSS